MLVQILYYFYSKQLHYAKFGNIPDEKNIKNISKF